MLQALVCSQHVHILFRKKRTGGRTDLELEDFASSYFSKAVSESHPSKPFNVALDDHLLVLLFLPPRSIRHRSSPPGGFSPQ